MNPGGAPMTPERFLGIVRMARSVQDAHAERDGTISMTAMEPVQSTAKMIRHAMTLDGIAPDWLLAEDWTATVPW